MTKEWEMTSVASTQASRPVLFKGKKKEVNDTRWLLHWEQANIHFNHTNGRGREFSSSNNTQMCARFFFVWNLTKWACHRTCPTKSTAHLNPNWCWEGVCINKPQKKFSGTARSRCSLSGRKSSLLFGFDYIWDILCPTFFFWRVSLTRLKLETLFQTRKWPRFKISHTYMT